MKIRDVYSTQKFAPSEPSDRLVCSETVVGVEVETEGARLSLYDMCAKLDYWKGVTDGSLKSNSPFEFVFCQGLAGQQVVRALEEITPVLKEAGCVYPLNTSVHVHVNIGEMTTEELRRFMYLAIVTESALIQYSGARWNNCFCIPWFCMSPSVLSHLGQFCDTGSMYDMPNVKYTSLNFSTINTLGTIEFRMMEGTGDGARILDWINVILALKVAASKSDFDPRSNFDYIMHKGDLMQFLTALWPRSTVRQMMHPQLHDHMTASSYVARVGLYPKMYDELREWLSSEGLDVPSRRKSKKLFRNDEHVSLSDWVTPSAAALDDSF